MRQHLRRQRAIVAGPAHIALDALAERFLRDADLQRAEARLGADLRGDHLIDRRSARAVSGERRARRHTAHRLVVAVAGAGRRGSRVVQAAENVNVVAERGQRRQARRQVEVARRSRLGIQYRSGMPLPLNQKTKRLSIALSATLAAAFEPRRTPCPAS